MIAISEILREIKHVKFIGNSNQLIHEIISIKELIDIHDQSKYLTWCSLKNEEFLVNIKSGTVICDKNTNYKYLTQQECNYILVDNPRKSFRDTLEYFFIENEPPCHFIATTAIIDTSVLLGNKIRIGHNVIIEKGVVIGDNTQINHNTVIHQKTIIGKNVKIGCNCTIGGIGFGYELNELGEFELIPHIGNVVIDDSVEIGNNTCIDRAVLGATKIMKNVKIDNLVHIAHGAHIGENSLIIANSVIAGSAKIGKNVWIAPTATIKNNISIGDNCTIGLGAVVIKDVESNLTIIGNPGRELNK